MTGIAAESRCGFATGQDELGSFVVVNIDPLVFSEAAILKTAYWFTDSHYVFVSKDRATGHFRLELRLKAGDDLVALKSACGEFWNQLLDYGVRQVVLAETSPVRDILIKKAFFEAKARPPPGLLSNETAIERAAPTDAGLSSTAPRKS